MKSSWKRVTEIVEIDVEDIVQFTDYSSNEIMSIELLEGGLKNTNYKIKTDTGPVILRIMKDLTKAKVEEQVTAFLTGIIPFPRIIWSEEVEFNDSSQAWSILEYVEGKPLAKFKDQLNQNDLNRIYRHAGTCLSKISAFEFDVSGFFNADLTIGQKLVIDENTYVELVDDMLTNGVAQFLDHLPPKIMTIARQNASLLQECDTTPRLCHGDFNAENIMIRNKSITSILDWEFAISLSPLLDLGNFLRYEDNLEAEHVREFIKGFRDGGRQLPRNWKKIIRLYDLISLLSMLLDQEKVNQPKLLDIRNRINHYLDELINGS